MASQLMISLLMMIGDSSGSRFSLAASLSSSSVFQSSRSCAKVVFSIADPESITECWRGMFFSTPVAVPAGFLGFAGWLLREFISSEYVRGCMAGCGVQ